MGERDMFGWRVDPGKLATRLRMLVSDMRGGIAPAVENLEDLVVSQMGVAK